MNTHVFGCNLDVNYLVLTYATETVVYLWISEDIKHLLQEDREKKENNQIIKHQ